MPKELKRDVEVRKTMCEQREIKRKLKKNPKETLELKSTITKINILLEGFNSRYKCAEEESANLMVRPLKLCSLSSRRKKE